MITHSRCCYSVPPVTNAESDTSPEHEQSMMSSRSIRAAAYRWNLDERKCLTAARLPAAQTSDPQKQMDGTATENGGRAHVDSVWGMLAYLVVHMFDLCF
jgi:hypothetical protein